MARAAAGVPWQVSWVGPYYGPLAVNATYMPASGDLWLAFGVGVTIPAQSVSGGPLTGYEPVLNDVMTGWAFGADFGLGIGGQVTWNDSRSFSGPTGTYGVSAS